MEEFSSIIGDASETNETLDANHRTMCKFDGPEDDNYAIVLHAIKRYVQGIELAAGLRPGK